MVEREQAWARDMRAANAGDARAYERLLSQVALTLRVLVRRRLSRLHLSADEAEDVVQEALLAVHLKRHTWDETRQILPWVYAIARYKIIDAARRLRRVERNLIEMPVEDLADVLPAPEGHLDRVAVDVERHLAALPGRQQEVVRALTVEGATVQAVAQKLNISEGAVRVALHRGLAALSTRMRESDAGQRR